MRRSLARFSGPVSLIHAPSLADSITTTLEFRFSVHTIPRISFCLPAYADGTPVRVRGSVVSLDGPKLVVHAKDGNDVAVSLADNFAALAVVKSSMADIKVGTFIGTATVTQSDTTLRSVEVVVFPDSLRGTAEGHYPWDLGSSSMMTNATVANAVKAVDGQTVTVTYKAAKRKLISPPMCRSLLLFQQAKTTLRPVPSCSCRPNVSRMAPCTAARCFSARTA
jgi:hypothetical protein